MNISPIKFSYGNITLTINEEQEKIAFSNKTIEAMQFNIKNYIASNIQSMTEITFSISIEDL